MKGRKVPRDEGNAAFMSGNLLGQG